MNKLMHIVRQFVYWSSVVGPIYSLIKGTWQGFVSAVQNIREEARLEAERDRFDNLDTFMVDLSQTSDAYSFSNMVDSMKGMKGKNNDNAI